MKFIIPYKKSVHFIGIGGIGVSALARYFLSQKYKVSGSDFSSSEITNHLKKDGVKIYVGHKPSNINKSINLVIHSAAIQKENPELQTAVKLNIPIQSYSQALGELVKNNKTVAISGAHGKSTTTAMSSLVFQKAKFDPTVIIGTKLKEFKNTNFKSGKSEYLIIEADEYHRAFLNYSPFAAIITNIDREHLDYYKNLAEIKSIFLKFVGNIKAGGILVANKDDKNLFSLADKIKKITDKNNIKVYWYSRQLRAFSDLRRILKVPGDHNASNALAVYTLAKALSIEDNVILKALADYRGAWRRMELRGGLSIKNIEYRNKNKKNTPSILNPQSSILVFDDYAHHPTEIKATLAAFRQKYPKSKIICIFQPHQEKRLKALFKEFSSAFDDADNLILLDIYKVKGRDEVSQNVDSLKLTETVAKRKSSPSILYLKNPKNLKKEIKKIITLYPTKPYTLNPVLIMMGAGDIYKMTDELLK